MVCAYFRAGQTPTHGCCRMECARSFLIIVSNVFQCVNPCEAPLLRWLINNPVTWVTWLWLQVTSLKLGFSWIGRSLSNAFVCVVLDSLAQSIPLLHNSGFVSAIPCTPLTLCNPSWTDIQVRGRGSGFCTLPACTSSITRWVHCCSYQRVDIQRYPVLAWSTTEGVEDCVLQRVRGTSQAQSLQASGSSKGKKVDQELMGFWQKVSSPTHDCLCTHLSTLQ